MITAILPAGGLGKRLGADIPKQFLPLAGKPLILYSLEAFVQHPQIKNIIIPVVANWRQNLEDLLADLLLQKEIILVPGGRTRQDSVYHGLKALPQGSSIVLVHDVARPLVTPQIIERVIQAVEKYGAAIAATPVRDTVKMVEGEIIKETIPREKLFLAQTPQGARVELMLRAFEAAYRDDFIGTDEASLLERIGIPVHIVPAPMTNFKITTPEDLRLAEALLRLEHY